MNIIFYALGVFVGVALGLLNLSPAHAFWTTLITSLTVLLLYEVNYLYSPVTSLVGKKSWAFWPQLIVLYLIPLGILNFITGETGLYLFLHAGSVLIGATIGGLIFNKMESNN